MIDRSNNRRSHVGALCLMAAIAPLFTANAAVAAGPLRIERGGTYRGTFKSDDPAIAAITIATSEPVVVNQAAVRGPGDLIVSRVEHADVTIRDVSGESIPAVNRPPGRFLSAEGFDHVAVENCLLDHTAGIYLLDYEGGASPGHGVRILRNRARNIDGRWSDGRGGFVTGKVESVQFAALDKVRHAPAVEIAWNEVVNEPLKSAPEDVINMYLSSGTPASPIRIHDNFIRGAFPPDPSRGDYSGGGIMLGDGVAKDGPDGDPAYVIASENTVLDTVNYGITASAGHHLCFERNRIFSAGTLPDGSRPAAQNVGACVWDSYKAGAARFHDNGGRDNLIGWVSAKGVRNDWWRPDAAFWENNRRWPEALTPALYESEHARWLDLAKLATVTIGPRR